MTPRRTDPLRLLLVSPAYPPESGGPSHQCRQLTRQLQAFGVEVQVALPGDRDGVNLDENIVIHRVRKDTGRRVRSRWQRWRHYCNRLDEIVRITRCEVVHLQVFGDPFIHAAGLAARRLGRPTLLKFTGERACEQVLEHRIHPGSVPSRAQDRLRYTLLHQVDRKLAHGATRLWSTTPEMTSWLSKRFGISKARIHTIPNFVDTDAFVPPVRARIPPETEINLLTVARLRPWKGIETGLEAMHLLRNECSIHWTIVGAGHPPYEQALQRKARALNLQDVVHFAGDQPPDTVRKALHDAHLFMLLSEREPFGIALIEAMATALPVVATDVDGIPHAIGSGPGATLVPPGDAQAAADAIQRIARDTANYPARSSAARAHALLFSQDQVVDRLLSVYRHLSGREAGHAGQPCLR